MAGASLGPVSRGAVVFATAFGATLLGSMSGGSVSLLTTPAWLTLGFPLPIAVASDKLAGSLWTVLGAKNYLRDRPVDRVLLIGLIATGLVGALLGTRVTIGLDPTVLKRIVGGLVVLVVLIVAARPAIGRMAGPPTLSRGMVSALGFPLGFYEGMLGSGNGIATTLLLATGRGFDLRTALGHYYLVASAWCAFAAIGYAAQGYFDLRLALPATIGALGGGYLGSRLGSVQSAPAARSLFLVAGLGLGVVLLVGRRP